MLKKDKENATKEKKGGRKDYLIEKKKCALHTVKLPTL